MSGIHYLGTEGCTVTNVNLKDGKLTLDLRVNNKGIVKLDSRDYFELSECIRRDLLNYNIPHTRVIGVQVVTNGLIDSRYISKLAGTDTSYAELLVVLDKLIYSGIVIDNELVEKTVLASIDKEVTTAPGIIRVMSNSDIPLKALRPNINLMSWTSDSSSNTVVKFVTLYSKGMVDFVQAAEHIKYTKGGEFMPLRAVYDLMKVFTVHKYSESTSPECVQLHYKCEIDEDVLKDILILYLNRLNLQEDE